MSNDELHQLPMCHIHKERFAIRRTDNTKDALIYTLDCGHRIRVNPDRGSVVEKFQKDGKDMVKIDNRMYIPLEEDTAEQELTDSLQKELESKANTIDKLDATIAELTATIEKLKAPAEKK